MATARSVELRALAQRIAEALPPEAIEVVLTGSVSRGLADEVSDIEMLVVTEEPLSLEEAFEQARRVGLQERASWGDPSTPTRRVFGYLEGRPVETIWWSRELAEERLSTGGSAEAIASGVALRTSGLLAGWQKRLADYPAELATERIEQAAQRWGGFAPAGLLTIVRDDTALARMEWLVEAAKRVLAIVFALNRVHPPASKRLAARVEPLAVKPEQLAERIEQALAEPDPRQALTLMSELQLDTVRAGARRPERRPRANVARRSARAAAVTQRSRKLRARAESVAALLPAYVEDVVLTGSASRGIADDLSDIELLVISDPLPGELPIDERQSWSPGVEGAMWYGGIFEGEKVELVWWTPAYAEERVRAIVAGEIVDHARLRSAEAIVHGIPLRGARHADYCARLARYPGGLAARIVDDVTDEWIDWVDSQRSNLRAGAARVAPAQDRRERVPVLVDGDEAVREARGRVRLVISQDASDSGRYLAGIVAVVLLLPQLAGRLGALVEPLRAHRGGADVECEQLRQASSRSSRAVRSRASPMRRRASVRASRGRCRRPRALRPP
ncbi:MAG TPA: nucleotidyltransferase domain-containing protein, partial [Gaiellaceae bacterium]|nr:nucleotidyltransferase domain-containing protein [Gaiellaceae bacterium]